MRHDRKSPVLLAHEAEGVVHRPIAGELAGGGDRLDERGTALPQLVVVEIRVPPGQVFDRGVQSAVADQREAGAMLGPSSTRLRLVPFRAIRNHHHPVVVEVGVCSCRGA
jgi:hypothetical protein